MESIQGAAFRKAFDKGGSHFRDLHVHDCTFDNCGLSMVTTPARAAFYAETDWALDISEAKLLGLRCQGVPLPLIKRDPQTQVILDKQGRYGGHQALGAGFGQAFPVTDSVLRGFDESNDQTLLLAASLAAPKARRDAEKGAIAELRALGFLED